MRTIGAYRVGERRRAGREQRGGVDVLQEELHRRELSLAGVADDPRRAGVEDDVGVAGRVDEGVGPHRHQAPLGRDDDRLEPRPVDQRVGDEGVEEQGDAGLGRDHSVEQPLGGPRHVEQHRARLEGDGPGGRPATDQRGRDLLGHAAGDEGPAAAVGDVEATNRPDRRRGEVATEEAVPLEQAHPRPGPGRGEGRGQPGRPGAGDADVDVGQHVELSAPQHRHGAGG